MGAFNAGPILPNVNGRVSLASQLWTPTDKLIVSPRRRVTASTTTGALAAGATTSVAINFPLSGDTILAGDGLLIDLPQFNWANVTSFSQLVTLTTAFFQVHFADGSACNLGQPITTTLQASGNVIFSVNPQLWTSWDLNFLRNGGGLAPLTPVQMPWSFIISAFFFNGSAAPQTINLTGFVFSRFVRGLEEQ